MSTRMASSASSAHQYSQIDISFCASSGAKKENKDKNYKEKGKIYKKLHEFS